MTDRAAILAAYMRHETRLGGPDKANEAIAATAHELGLARMKVFEVILTSRLMAGNGGTL